jgi:hypothetical protein
MTEERGSASREDITPDEMKEAQEGLEAMFSMLKESPAWGDLPTEFRELVEVEVAHMATIFRLMYDTFLAKGGKMYLGHLAGEPVYWHLQEALQGMAIRNAAKAASFGGLCALVVKEEMDDEEEP